MNATVYRAAQTDRNGDPVDADGNVVRIGADGTEVGTVSGLIMGDQTVDAGNRVASTYGMVGIPTDQLALLPGDTLVTEYGVRFRVGPVRWQGARHSLTGSTTTARYRWHEVTALVN